MNPSSMKLVVAALLIFFFLTPSLAIVNNITLFGDAFFNNYSVTLTRETNCRSPPPPSPTAPFGVGGVIYGNPFQFLDPSTNGSSSFSCSFSFTINNTLSCPSGDGLAFLITSKTDSFSLYMGLPEEIQGSYFAVEFDTNFNMDLQDINDNHIAIDVNSVKSLASVDLVSTDGVDLKEGRRITAWIEYRDSEKMVRVWVGYSQQIRPINPVLELTTDLSKKFKEFMYVGFTASNGKGSSVHTVDNWRFKTLLPSKRLIDSFQEWDCLICSPDDPGTKLGPFEYYHNPRNKIQIMKLGLIFGGPTLALILFVLVVLYCICMMRRRKIKQARSERQLRRFHRGTNMDMGPKMLSLNEIKSATGGFNESKIIGEGASAIVYKGTIPSCGAVAVKRFNQDNSFDSSISRIPFNTEFGTVMGCLRHKNLVQLQGWCCEKNELVLVYEHMANGSLEKILHNCSSLTKFLTWERRFSILKGVASALIYLHEECENQIIHRDVKTCNILLDDEFNAKLGDFGLAEVYRHSIRAREATVPAGTMGYLAPEYAFSGIPTVKTDVYSFGVVILEVVTGRRPVDESRIVITDFVWDLWEKGILIEGADPGLMGRFNRMEMERTLMVGLSCAHFNCDKRPSMRDATRMLRGELPLPVLPSRKPTVRIQSVLPEGCEEIMSIGGEGFSESPWSTPMTHFSRN